MASDGLNVVLNMDGNSLNLTTPGFHYPTSLGGNQMPKQQWWTNLSVWLACRRGGATSHFLDCPILHSFTEEVEKRWLFWIGGKHVVPPTDCDGFYGGEWTLPCKWGF